MDNIKRVRQHKKYNERPDKNTRKALKQARNNRANRRSRFEEVA